MFQALCCVYLLVKYCDVLRGYVCVGSSAVCVPRLSDVFFSWRVFLRFLTVLQGHKLCFQAE